MAQISITQAAKLAGVSRSNLYKSYINKGIITISKDDRGKSCIETSELLRVFQVLQSNNDKEDTTGHDSTQKENIKEVEVTALKSEIEQLRQQLSKSEEREGWYQTQIQNLTDTMKLLESPKKSPLWWKFWK